MEQKKNKNNDDYLIRNLQSPRSGGRPLTIPCRPVHSIQPVLVERQSPRTWIVQLSVVLHGIRFSRDPIFRSWF